MKFVKLKNGEIGGVALNIEKKIGDYFIKNIELKESTLEIVKFNIRDKDDDEFLYVENYIFLKETKEKLKILDSYDLYTSEEENKLQEFLAPFVVNVDYKFIKNYNYMDNISTIWKEYVESWGLG